MTHLTALLHQVSNLPHMIWENMAEIGGYILVGVTALLAARAKDWLGKTTTDIRTAVTLDKRLYQIMAELRVILQADRVKLFQFMNGDYYLGGISKQKVTLTHIVTRTGVSYPLGLVNAKDEIVTSQLTDLLSTVIENHSTLFSQVDDVKDAYLQQ